MDQSMHLVAPSVSLMSSSVSFVNVHEARGTHNPQFASTSESGTTGAYSVLNQHQEQRQGQEQGLDDGNFLPEDLSVSTDQSSFPSLRSLPSLSPRIRSPSGKGGSVGGVNASSSVVTSATKGHIASKYHRNPYHITGSEPPRPFSPPTMQVPDTKGVNWSRQESQFDKMLQQVCVLRGKGSERLFQF